LLSTHGIRLSNKKDLEIQGETLSFPKPVSNVLQIKPRLSHFPLSHRFGSVSLEDIMPISENLLFLTGISRTEYNDQGRIIYLDTETTGLSGGAGTYIFLLGLGEVLREDNIFRVKQFLLQSPSRETAFLTEILEEMKGCTTLICFNGKSYDLPLLQTRLMMNRLPSLPGEPVILDLLYPARNVWKKRIGPCDLQSLERHVMGYYREDDLPGALIPERFFRYLRSGDLDEIEAVYHHNLLDMLAMAALVSLLNRSLTIESSDDFESLHCLTRRLCINWKTEDFAHLLQSHGELINHAVKTHAGVGISVAYLYKRSGFREQAYHLFLHLSQTRPKEAPEALEEVLIYEEHHLKDLYRALDHCHRFLHLISRWPDHSALQDNLLYRKNRLERKIRKKESSAN